MKFRSLAIILGAVGIAMGVAFCVGLAMGKGNPKTVQSGLSSAQIQQLYGASTNGGGTGTGAGGAQATGGTTGASGATGAPAAASANVNLGRITSVDGTTVTIETAAG